MQLNPGVERAFEMKPSPGIGALETPSDLLAKLRHDFKRMRVDPFDAYSAFDFFVTAEHLADWILPGRANDSQRRTLKEAPLLSVISHIANGAKHFFVEDKRHTSVRHVDSVDGAFDPGIFDPGVFDTGGLVVTLEGPAAVTLGTRVSALSLAEQTIAFWEQKLGK